MSIVGSTLNNREKLEIQKLKKALSETKWALESAKAERDDLERECELLLCAFGDESQAHSNIIRNMTRQYSTHVSELRSANEQVRRALALEERNSEVADKDRGEIIRKMELEIRRARNQKRAAESGRGAVAADLREARHTIARLQAEIDDTKTTAVSARTMETSGDVGIGAIMRAGNAVKLFGQGLRPVRFDE